MVTSEIILIKHLVEASLLFPLYDIQVLFLFVFAELHSHSCPANEFSPYTVFVCSMLTYIPLISPFTRKKIKK